MDVNEWMSCEYSDTVHIPAQNIHNSFTRSHPSEEEKRSKNCKCKRALRSIKYVTDAKLIHIAMFFKTFYIAMNERYDFSPVIPVNIIDQTRFKQVLHDMT